MMLCPLTVEVIAQSTFIYVITILAILDCIVRLLWCLVGSVALEDFATDTFTTRVLDLLLVLSCRVL